MFDEDHAKWLRIALQEAVQAFDDDEVPVGAVIVQDDRIVGRGHNQGERLRDPTAHAEMLAITQATATLGSARLVDCRLYVTLEPCAMCAGAILLARIPHVIYGASDPKAGAVRSLMSLLSDARLNHRSEITSGILAEDCSDLLKEFFRRKRSR